MKIKSIYINLPVKDLNKTREFWSKLGFTFNTQFNDDKSLCLILNEGTIYAMFLIEQFFSSFTDRPVADDTTTQVTLALEVESREQVNQIVTLALANGGSRYKESQDHGWMYYDSFADPDGHQWEVLFTDITKLPQEDANH